ncbi:translation initiation factor IF-2 N-terminal domain-containing protein, partial [Corallococcus terminator]|uniref:translation initiation factor IF-2 N-terminal domain-containing protein n=1 Tax=Corallococcus terminator TaxID=2316733 RepID=UPI001FC8F2B2
MSKKRVHEIAKELKSHGIELDNKEVVTELSGLGYDVKSHSSSLDDDQATAAVQKILDKRKPKQAAAPVAAKGFVVRRRVGPPAGASNTEAQDAYAQSNDQGYDNPDASYEQSAPSEQTEAAQASAAETAPAAVEQAPQAHAAPEAPAVTAASTEAAATPAATEAPS